MENIVILYGGKSGEHEVSLRSAASVLSNLDKTKYKPELIGIDKNGIWYYQKNIKTSTDGQRLELVKENPVSVVPSKGFFCGNEKIECDAVLPIIHGTQGEDGTIQGLLEIVNVPYAGAGVLGSALSLDKEKTKIICQGSGLPVAPFRSFLKNIKINRDEVIDELGLPLFVKPARTGSSVGVYKVHSADEFDDTVKKAFQFDSKILIETAIDAHEVECSVIGNYSPKAFNPGFVVPTHEFYDYEAKYIDPDGAEKIIPAPFPAEILARVKEIAEKAYLLTETRGMARIDFFIDKKNSEIYLNEVNTIPGFTNISMFSKLCEADGLSYPQILEELIRLAKEMYLERNELTYSIF